MTRSILLYLLLVHFNLSAQVFTGVASRSADVPAVQEQIFIHTDRSFYLAGETIWFRIYYFDATTRKPLLLSKVSYVEILSSEGKPAIQSRIELKDGKGFGNFSLPLSIVSGNYILRAYTRWMRNDGPDVFFETPITIVNTSRRLPLVQQKSPSVQGAAGDSLKKNTETSEAIEVRSDKAKYGKREKVQLTMSALKSPDSVFAMSVAVYRIDRLQTSEHASIAHVMTQPKTQTVKRNASGQVQFLPEYEGHIIEATVKHRSSRKPAAGVAAFMSIPGSRFHFQGVRSDEQGKAIFIAKNYYGAGELILQSNYTSDSMYQVELVNPFDDSKPKTSVQPFSIDPDLEELLLQRSIGVQVENAFTSNKKEEYLLPELRDSTAFYGKPDYTYNLDEYTRFMTMEEVMREFIAEVRVRKTNNRFYFDVRNNPYKLFFDQNPLLLIDGVPVFDINKIMAVDPLKVQRIDLMTQKVYQGEFGYNGIVTYRTYNGNLEGYTLDPNAVILNYPGLQLQREFFSPEYPNELQKKSRTPDYRNLLYWHPDLQLQSSPAFYTSDVTGKYIVVLQGMSNQGTPVYSTTTFEVE